MNRVRPGRALAVALVLIGIVSGAHAQAPTEIWSGTSAGFDVRWTTSDIDVRRDGRRAFSAREWAQVGLAHFIAVNRGSGAAQPPDCDYRRRIRIIALVGPLMSLEDSIEINCRREAHPGGMARLITVDLAAAGPFAQAGRDAIGRVDPRQPGRAVLLPALFPDAEVLAALAGAPPLRDVLRRDGSRPATLPSLLDAIANASGEGDACFIVPPDVLAGFAFHGVENDRLVVRLGLPGDGPCRMNLTTADLTFALPGALVPAVRKAASGDAGFLAVRGEAIAAGRATVIELRSGRGGDR